jgi:hypothetical protein
MGWTHPLTEMCTKNNCWGKGGRCVGLKTLPLSCADCLKSVRVKLQEPSGLVKVCNGIALPLPQTQIQLINSFKKFKCFFNFETTDSLNLTQFTN